REVLPIALWAVHCCHDNELRIFQRCYTCERISIAVIALGAGGLASTGLAAYTVSGDAFLVTGTTIYHRFHQLEHFSCRALLDHALLFRCWDFGHGAVFIAVPLDQARRKANALVGQGLEDRSGMQHGLRVALAE